MTIFLFFFPDPTMAKVLKLGTSFVGRYLFATTHFTIGSMRQQCFSYINSCHLGTVPQTFAIISGHFNTRKWSSNVTNKQSTVFLLDKKGKDMGNVTLEEAESYAEKSSLKLELVSHKHGDEVIDVYQLASNKGKDNKPHAEGKKAKLHKLTFKSTITDHDAKIKIKQIEQWLEKGDEVKVNIKFLNNEKVSVC